MDFSTLAEEPLKNAIRERYFKEFICSGDQIDFHIYAPKKQLPRPLLWAEAKAGVYDPIKGTHPISLNFIATPPSTPSLFFRRVWCCALQCGRHR